MLSRTIATMTAAAMIAIVHADWICHQIIVESSTVPIVDDAT